MQPTNLLCLFIVIIPEYDHNVCGLSWLIVWNGFCCIYILLVPLCVLWQLLCHCRIIITWDRGNFIHLDYRGDYLEEWSAQENDLWRKWLPLKSSLQIDDAVKEVKIPSTDWWCRNWGWSTVRWSEVKSHIKSTN